jgi:hypothetical protein
MKTYNPFINDPMEAFMTHTYQFIIDFFSGFWREMLFIFLGATGIPLVASTLLLMGLTQVFKYIYKVPGVLLISLHFVIHIAMFVFLLPIFIDLFPFMVGGWRIAALIIGYIFGFGTLLEVWHSYKRTYCPACHRWEGQELETYSPNAEIELHRCRCGSCGQEWTYKTSKAT